jgi:hypothetical protein
VKNGPGKRREECGDDEEGGAKCVGGSDGSTRVGTRQGCRGDAWRVAAWRMTGGIYRSGGAHLLRVSLCQQHRTFSSQPTACEACVGGSWRCSTPTCLDGEERLRM